MIHDRSSLTDSLKRALNQSARWYWPLIRLDANPSWQFGRHCWSVRAVAPTHLRVYPDSPNYVVRELENQFEKFIREESPLRVVRLDLHEYHALATDRTEFELKVTYNRGAPAREIRYMPALELNQDWFASVPFEANVFRDGCGLYGSSEIHLEAGRFHSLSGPAIIHACGHLEWMIHGVKISPERMREEQIETLRMDEYRWAGERSWFRSDSDGFMYAMLADRVGKAA